jgi:diacylglycerol kinase (ATP)
MSDRPAALRAFLQGFAHAFRGIVFALRTQRNLRVHALATLSVIVLGFVLQIERWEWCAILISCGVVWAAELLNTAIECLADRVSMEREDAIRVVKDAAAGAVLAASLAAAVVGAIIFLPRLLT